MIGKVSEQVREGVIERGDEKNEQKEQMKTNGNKRIRQTECL